ncbi:MAG: exodeoxyribonuclease VII large subunit [Acidobacteria bacterium]|nr:exodeoxyribonuclease VII large subunit [Acidobacteriota bacterium]
MADDAAPARVFEVDEVVSALERVISEHTRTVYIRGEVVNLRSGRDGRLLWFRLEDPREGHDARVDCFAYATDVVDGHDLADGAVVQAVARPEFQRRDGRLTIRLRRIEPAGEGEILRMIAERRRRLAEEGLFDDSLKRPLPFVPTGVGLVTAAGSAARADVLRRIETRFPMRVVVAHAAMQGAACADEVTRAIVALDADPRVDVIVVARGGGSLQDLLPFSDEQVVRAIRASSTPVVAGIGHQPDTTLACLAADAHAATPTAAADLVVPDRAVLRDDLAALRRRVGAGAMRAAGRARRELDLIAARPGLVRPHDAVVRRPLEAVGALAARLSRAAREGVVMPARDLRALDARRALAIGSAQSGAAARLAVLTARLAAGDPGRPLAEGFALVRDDSGRLVQSAGAISPGMLLSLEFRDGMVAARVEEEA